MKNFITIILMFLSFIFKKSEVKSVEVEEDFVETFHNSLLDACFKCTEMRDNNRVYTIPAAIGRYTLLLLLPSASVQGSFTLLYINESGQRKELCSDRICNTDDPAVHMEKILDTIEECDASKLREASIKEELDTLMEHSQWRVLSPEQATRLVELEEELEECTSYGWYY